MKDFPALSPTPCARTPRPAGCHVGTEQEALTGSRLDPWSWSERLSGRGPLTRPSAGTQLALQAPAVSSVGPRHFLPLPGGPERHRGWSLSPLRSGGTLSLRAWLAQAGRGQPRTSLALRGFTLPLPRAPAAGGWESTVGCHDCPPWFQHTVLARALLADCGGQGFHRRWSTRKKDPTVPLEPAAPEP